ncbi:MAG: tRNA-(ms[2]io[6]A)-hydroxylase [Myxococcaceae bacterium]|jgi:tRNA-(ms[2]io[6]A)-hydroxylase|nr:tRNA-(ms[2]io[6]A)-hydroxylase [Myxococcaceae bacterium]
MELKVATDPRWLPHALAHFDELLVDHAHCEKKAAANALSLLQAHPEVPGLPAQMARLAREESAHLAKVLQLMETRGLALGRDAGDPYAKGLQQLIRHGAKERRLDRLLVAGIIESRSHERLQLLADGLTDPSLRRLYAELAKSEDGHQKLFVRLAKNVDPAEVVEARLEVLLTAEASLIAGLPLRAAVH